MDFKSLKGHGVGLNLQAIVNAIQTILISKNWRGFLSSCVLAGANLLQT